VVHKKIVLHFAAISKKDNPEMVATIHESQFLAIFCFIVVRVMSYSASDEGKITE
jgi:hypothetical protein